MSQLANFSESSIANPTASMGGIRTAGLDNINKTYDTLPQSVATQMARRGYGSSGNMGNSMYKVAMSRAGDVSNLEGKIAAMGVDRQNAGASLGTQLLGLNRGTTSTGTTPDTSAGNAFMSAGNGLSNMSTLMMFNNLLKPGSGGGGGDYGGSGGFSYNPVPFSGGSPSLMPGGSDSYFG